MDRTVVSYVLYLLITVPLTIWVATALRRHGEVFLLEVFRGNERLAHAVNQLLVIGFYLLNFGFLSLFLSSGRDISDNRGVMEVVSTKVGAVAVVLGVLHFANLWGLNAFRRRAMLHPGPGASVRPAGQQPRNVG